MENWIQGHSLEQINETRYFYQNPKWLGKDLLFDAGKGKGWMTVITERKGKTEYGIWYNLSVT